MSTDIPALISSTIMIIESYEEFFLIPEKYIAIYDRGISKEIEKYDIAG